MVRHDDDDEGEWRREGAGANFSPRLFSCRLPLLFSSLSLRGRRGEEMTFLVCYE
jgi:hypothetical protein